MIGKNRYHITSDAYPSFAKRVFEEALTKAPKTAASFIDIANNIAAPTRAQGVSDSKWIDGKVSRSFGWPFEEYIWVVDLKIGTVHNDVGAVRAKWQVYKARDGREIAFSKPSRIQIRTADGDTALISDVRAIRLLRSDIKSDKSVKLKAPI